jgi:D-glycero-alpha-D-manno-heptose-7-phosphate kinase
MRLPKLRYGMAKRITVKVPVRIDLAGGWTDVPRYCSTHQGEVVNVAINRYVTAECSIDDERKVNVTYQTQLPTGCGLGTSGAMNVALVSAICDVNEAPESVAEKAYQIEAILGNTGGRQDQWASAFGGVQHLTFDGESVRRAPLVPSPAFRTWLEKHLLLFDTGLPHVSGELHQAVWARYDHDDEQTTEGLLHLHAAAQKMHESVQNENREGFATAWRMVMKGVDLLDLDLHGPFRTSLEPLEHQGHVVAWKAMGAGGGGVVGVLQSGKGDARQSITDALTNAGWTPVTWAIEDNGIQRRESFNHE